MAHRVASSVCPLCGASEYLSPRAIASEYGLHYRTVWRHIKAGDLVGRRFGKAWRIRRSDLEAYLARALTEPQPWSTVMPEADHAPRFRQAVHALEAQAVAVDATLQRLRLLHAAMGDDEVPHVIRDLMREVDTLLIEVARIGTATTADPHVKETPP